MLKGISKRLLGAIGTKLRWAFLGVGVVTLAGVGSLSLNASTAQAVDLSNPLGSLGGGGLTGALSSYGGNVSTCAIDTVGWIVCPTMRSIAKLADYGFAFINTNFLRLEYNITGGNSGVFKSWQMMQTIANVLFVLALMVIAYMQITGKGGTYNIKRMLPRLVIAAIAVNLSYFICAIAIEVTGIFGDGILAALRGITQQVGQAAMSLDSAKQGFNDSRITDITTAVLNKNGTVWILLAPVAAVAVAIAITCAVALVILIMRKVVVSMLVLVAPIAFVLYLLPNTEHFFQQWRRLFVQLLLLYPVVAFLLGTGQIISATIMNVGTGDKNSYRVADDSYFPRNGGSGSTMTDLAAAGAAALPLLGTWFIMKNVTAFATNAGARVAGRLGSKQGEQDEKMKAKLKAKEEQLGKATGLPSYDRGPAFRRQRRKAGEGLGALPSGAGGQRTGGSSKLGGASSGEKPSASLFDRMTGNINGAGDVAAKNSQADADKKLEDINNAKISEAQAALAGDAALAAKEDDKKKSKTAKDIFNNMNESHHMKDKDKQNGPAGAGAPPGQQGGGGSGGSGNGQPGPSTEYRAPNIMQNQGIKTGGTTGGGVQQVVAVPVAVDASTFINKKPTPGAGGMPAGAGSIDGISPPPSTEIQKKANERAQRYIFDSTKDTDQAPASGEDQQKRMIRDAFGHKRREK